MKKLTVSGAMFGLATDGGDLVWTGGGWTDNHDNIRWMSHRDAKGLQRSFKDRGHRVEIVRRTLDKETK